MTDFVYDFQEDNSIFFQQVIRFNGLRVNVSACTVSGDPKKQNEDAFAVSWNQDSLYLMCLDGVTNLIPLKSFSV